MSNLIVADVAVRQDDQGRFCLNDLHRAAGGERRHEPNRFLRLDTSSQLIEELFNSPDVGNEIPLASKAGRYGGTFVVKELVYAYAMWISPAFHLKVIRAYDELQTQGVAFSERTVEKVESGELEEDEVVMKALSILQSKVERLEHERDGMAKTIGQSSQSLTRVARLLPGVNSTKIKSDLKRLGYLWRTAGFKGTYRVYTEYRDIYFTEKHTEDGRQVDIHVTPEGKALLGRLYEEGKLTMKVSYMAA
ncbi:KilA-N domain-containing protein [Marinospirillum perlucidum]|uniref:KilA-N domain-containing protein n=1 Tax=Marinospirillum perlucidum TaxID=1982602 RepID=UPI001C497E82|nr:KilA-N domain-containing protein [Marinospirillum perlucidum]